MNPVAGIVLAAGMGTRMRSELIKVLHPLGGRPMVTYPIAALRAAGAERIVVVVGHQAEKVRALLGDTVLYAEQMEQLGTAHAVRQAESALAGFDGQVIITYGDTPLYRPETYKEFLDAHVESGAAASVLSTHVDDPHGYGRIVRAADGSFLRNVEQRDIDSDEVAAITEINTGTYCFQASRLFSALAEVNNDNDQGEYYLPDALSVLKRRGEHVRVHVLEDSDEALGINDRRQLAHAEGLLVRRTLDELMRSGVSVVDPRNTYVQPGVRIGPDTIILPFTTIEGNTEIGRGCEIGPHCRLRDARLGDRVRVFASVVDAGSIPSGEVVGPFAFVTKG